MDRKDTSIMIKLEKVLQIELNIIEIMRVISYQVNVIRDQATSLAVRKIEDE